MSGSSVGGGGRRVYLDYNATTPLAPEVTSAVTQAMTEAWGNPSSGHEEGARARSVVSQAREDVARMIGATPQDILFTSGGTESNNLVLHCAVTHFRKWCLSQDSPIYHHLRPHIITTKVEHDAIKLPLTHRYSIEADVTYLGVENLPEAVRDSIRPSTCLITVMLANNETGIMFSVAHIGRLLAEINKKRESEGLFKALLHTDAAQAIGKVPVDVTDLNVDYLTLVGHKYYGPRIGALYVRGLGHKTPVYPLFYGGGQERGYRPGTENTPMIAGLGRASLSGGCVVQVAGPDILRGCGLVQASCGAACHANADHHNVLEASGVCSFHASRTIRLSIGRETTMEDVDMAIQDIKQAIEKIIGRAV